MDSEDDRIAHLLRATAGEAAGPGVPDAVGRARRRLRVRRARRVGAGVTAAVTGLLVTSLTLQNNVVSHRDGSGRRNEARGPGVVASRTPSVAPSSASPNGARSTPGGESLQPQPTGTPTRPGEPAGCPPPPPRRAPDGITVTLELPKTEALPGEPVTMVLRVRNGGTGTVTWPRATTQAYDFWVRRGDEVVWRWSRGHTFAPAAQTTTVQPGDESHHAEVWDQSSCLPARAAGPQPAGRYVAQALVHTSEGGWWSNPVEFIIR